MHGNYGVFDVIMQYCSSILFAAGQCVRAACTLLIFVCDNNMCVRACVPEPLSLCAEDMFSMVWCHTFLDSYYTRIAQLDKPWPESCRIGR